MVLIKCKQGKALGVACDIMLPLALWSQAEREQHDVRVEKTLAVKRKQTVASRNQAAAAVAAKGEYHWCVLACVAEKVRHAQAETQKNSQNGRFTNRLKAGQAPYMLLCGFWPVHV